MKILNEREQMKNWIAISEAQQLEENIFSMVMAPFKFLGRMAIGLWNIMKGVLKVLSYIIEYSGKGVMIMAAPAAWISKLFQIVFRALAGTGHFANEFGKDIRKFMESQGIDGNALMEERSDIQQMIEDINAEVKKMSQLCTPEQRERLAQLGDAENEESQKIILAIAKKLIPMVKEPSVPKKTLKPNVSPSGEPLEPGTLKPFPGDLK